jgi:thioredoxin reductase
MSVLVVGGGDSAIEAACTLAESDNIDVTISYRSAAFTRAKARNRETLARAEQEGRLKVLLQSELIQIDPDKVYLSQGEDRIELANDAVIINAGGILPTSFLQSTGIAVETKYSAR